MACPCVLTPTGDSEAGELVGKDLSHAEAAVQAGERLVVEHDLALVAVGYDGGDAFVWPGAAMTFAHGDADVVDTTGAGDAMTAALTTVLCRGGGEEEAARLATAAAAVTVEHPGGRPNLTPERLANRGSAPRRWKW